MLTPILATLHPAILPLLIIAAVIVVLLGARKIAGSGKGMDEFRKAREEIAKHLNQAMENHYWDQYDAGDKTDVTERWMRNGRSSGAVPRPLWNRRHKLNFKRLRVVIVPRV